MLYDRADIHNVKSAKTNNKKREKSPKSSNSDFKLISTSIIIIQKGLYKSMQTIDHQIQVEITVIMEKVGAQQHNNNIQYLYSAL